MEKQRLIDAGLLVLRIGIGFMFIIHGAPKLFGGPESWQALGEMGMSTFGIGFGLSFWGFMAAFAEFFGGLCLIIGFLTRPFAILLFINMFVAAAMHLANGDGFKGASHAIEAGIVFLSLLISGPGRYSARQLIDPFKRKWFL